MTWDFTDLSCVRDGAFVGALLWSVAQEKATRESPTDYFVELMLGLPIIIYVVTIPKKNLTEGTPKGKNENLIAFVLVFLVICSKNCL